MGTKQPESLRLADRIQASGQFTELNALDEAAAELRRLHTENEALRHKLQTLEDLGAAGDDVQLLRMGYAAARLEIESLKAQLEAVGAGGVGPLRKHCIHQISEPAQDALKHVYSIAVSAVKTKSRDIADWREDMDRIATIASRAPNPERSDSAPSPIGAPDTVSETAPERIWLQIDPHGADIERAEPFPADDDGVTWCRDSVGGVEVAYVRADLGEGRCALEGAAVLAKWGAQPAGQALNSVRVFWQQHTQSDALSMTMAKLHDDVELVIRAARGAAQAAPVDAAARCKSCGTHEVSQQQTCHNSGCAVYAQDVTIYEGWKSHTPASSDPVAVPAGMPEPAAWAATSEDGNVEALGMNQSRRFDTPLYTSAQVQAMLAAAAQAQEDTQDYKRGYRDGYDQRDAEVKGALI